MKKTKQIKSNIARNVMRIRKKLSHAQKAFKNIWLQPGAIKSSQAPPETAEHTNNYVSRILLTKTTQGWNRAQEWFHLQNTDVENFGQTTRANNMAEHIVKYPTCSYTLCKRTDHIWSKAANVG